jgi:hypothetical protein
MLGLSNTFNVFKPKNENAFKILSQVALNDLK